MFSALRDEKFESVSDYEPVKHSYVSKHSDFDTLGSPGNYVITIIRVMCMHRRPSSRNGKQIVSND